MTVAPVGGSEVAPFDENDLSIGLEDVDQSDLRIPRLGIDHDKGVFVNSLTKEEYPTLTVVTLGLVKQRIFWPEKLEDDAKPRCKSPDNIHGFPNTNPTLPKNKQFPWAESVFSPTDAQPVDIEAGTSRDHPGGWSSNGYSVLSCAACNFSKWGKGDDGKGTPPPCNEQHTYPLLYMVEQVTEEGVADTVWVPAIFTVQRSAIANSKAYINGFAQAKQAFFTQYTGLTLRGASRGRNEYFIPEFRKMGPTDRTQWGGYAQQLRGIRDYLRQAPRPKDDDDSGTAPVESNVNTAPATVVSEPVAPPTQETAPVAPTPPPARPAAAPAAPRAAAATPPKPPAPAAPPAAPAPPAATTAEDDDLPF